MQILVTPVQAVAWSAETRSKACSIGFVPTMGALHEGHLDLVRRAKALTDRVVCSIYVNPLQFNNAADLERYPIRTVEDQALLKTVGCDALFAPTKEEIFNDFVPTTYDIAGLDLHWEGPSRPGHFQGVVNVVERLFHFVRPDVAFFGEKDRQQLRIISSVAERYHWPERIIGCATVRDPNGLALSSRNLRLSAEEGVSALALNRSLTKAAELAWKEPVESVIAAEMAILKDTAGVRPEYFGIAHPQTLEPLMNWDGLTEAIALVAAEVGPVRLIDNLTLLRS